MFNPRVAGALIFLIPSLAFSSGNYKSYEEIEKAKKNQPAEKYRPYNKANQIVVDRCVSCHKSFYKQSDNQWIESGLVLPGAPNKSPLFTSLIGTEGLGTHNMPPKKTDPPLPKEALTELENWILSLPRPKQKKGELSLFKGEKFDITVDPRKTLSEEALFHRCYSQLTRRRADSLEQNLLAVRTGNKSGLEGCWDFIQSVQFQFDGTIPHKKGTVHDEKSAFLKTIHQFHHNWFGAYNFHTGMESWANSEVMDAGEMAYRLTLSFFGNQFPFNRIVRGNDVYESIRSSKNRSDFLVHKQFGLHDIPWKKARFMLGNDMANPIPWKPAPTLMQKGRLVGIREIPKGRDRISKFYNSEHDLREFNVNYDIHHNLGGGALGSSAYILLNSGQEIGKKMDGGWHLHRRWSKAVLNDLLCREIPVVKKADVLSYVQPQSKLPFRKSASCMQCHATLGLMSGVVRGAMTGINNIVADQIYDLTNPKDRTVINLQMTVLKHFPTDKKLAPDLNLTEDDPHYAVRPPYGRLFMRDIYGRLIDVSLTNVESLGEQLAERDDLYVCAAKRYFKFLTGIDVNLNYVDRPYAQIDSPSRYFLNQLVEWGRELRMTQDLKILLKRIISSPVYRQRDFKIQSIKKKAP